MIVSLTEPRIHRRFEKSVKRNRSQPTAAILGLIRRAAVLCSITAPVAAPLSAQVPITFQYFYDDLNQLVKVVDSTGIVIQYVYDSVGNIVQINRSSAPAGTLIIYNLAPMTVAAGANLTIQGQGFSPTPAQNIVMIGGVAATVLSATSTTLVVLVPSNAVSGPITVQVGNAFATSSANETVLPLPIISSVNPKVALAGTRITTLTVTGANLTAATFSFGSGVAISNLSIAPNGASAMMTVSIPASANGRYVLIATNTAGPSDASPKLGFLPGTQSYNTLTVPGADPNADSDGDGLPNALEITLGTDPLSTDTDSDGFSDGLEVVSYSNPLDSTCTPLNCRLQGNVDSLTLSALNSISPTLSYEVDSRPISSLQLTTPSGQLLEANSIPISALSLSSAVSLLEADAIPFSSCNSTGSCSDYSGLSRSLLTETQAHSPRRPTNASAENVSTPAAFTVQQSSPSNHATGILPGHPITLLFSQPVDPSTFLPNRIQVVATDQPLFYKIQFSSDFRAAILEAELPEDSVIHVNVAAAVRDVTGDQILPVQIAFQTGHRPEADVPVVTDLRPSPGSSSIPAPATLSITLSSAVTLASAERALTVTQDGEVLAGFLTLHATTIEFAPSAPFKPGSLIEVAWSPPADGVAGRSEAFFTVARSIPESFRPILATPLTINNAPRNSVIDLRFNDEPDLSTVERGIRLVDGFTGETIPITIRSWDTKTLRIHPSVPLRAKTRYQFEITTDLKDKSGQATSPLHRTFQLGADDQWALPILTSIPPEAHELRTAPDGNIHLQFDQPINPSTLNREGIVLTDDGSSVEFALFLADDDKELILAPTQRLRQDAALRLKLFSLEDVAGNPIAPIELWSDVPQPFTPRPRNQQKFKR